MYLLLSCPRRDVLINFCPVAGRQSPDGADALYSCGQLVVTTVMAFLSTAVRTTTVDTPSMLMSSGALQ
jgi:hypothetical protein